MSAWITFVSSIINEYRETKVRFVQIGGNDGKLDDPINGLIVKNKWEGIIVEPIPEYFDMLKDTYKDVPSVKLVQAAIDVEKKKRRIYKAKEERVLAQIEHEGANWIQGCASFNGIIF